MAKGNPVRQKMINMMYLVLTALLALNVSKEVLNSFFEVNTGIQRTTENFNDKNNDTYSVFKSAAINNPEKFAKVRDKALEVKKKTDELSLYIQEMKYLLVNSVDGQVYLGNYLDVLDKEGKLIEEKAIKGKSFSQLTDSQKKLPIAYLKVKDNRTSSGELFLNKTVKKENQLAYKLSDQISNYADFLINLVDGNRSLKSNIETVCDVSPRKKEGSKVKVAWEEYNFYDMPAVGALTILSKIQSDLRSVESDIINYLKRNLDENTLKFETASAVVIPESKYVLRGDSFRSEVFIAANNVSTNPDVWVGDYTYDSINNVYSMIGNYDTIRVLNGKGLYSTRTNGEGLKKWGGLIAMKTEKGTEYYPFSGSYMVAPKTAVVSPTKMNVLYRGLEQIGGNPVKISVPGYSAGDLIVAINNGTIKPEKKSLGEYVVFPSKLGPAIVTVSVKNDDGKRAKMGEVKFRVKDPPPPRAFVPAVDDNGLIDKATLKTQLVAAKLDNFEFEGLKYVVTSFKLTGTYNSQQVDYYQKNGMKFTNDMEIVISNAASGSQIIISQIKAKLAKSKNKPERLRGDIVIELK